MKPSINWLLVFIPITVALEHGGELPAPLIFFSAALAIVPIAALIVHSTEHLATHTGDAVGGLLNATFGNAPELIIALVALRAGLVDMVRASIIGAILANLLLALGIAFPARRPALPRADLQCRRIARVQHDDAARCHESRHPERVQPVLLAGRHDAPGAVAEHRRRRCAAVRVCALLAVLTENASRLVRKRRVAARRPGHHAEKPWSVSRAVASLIGAAVLAAWMSEILVGAAEATGQVLGMSSVFIGVVLLAVVGGAAESGSAIAMATKNKVDLSRRHRARQLDPDRAVRGARAGVRELLHRARAARAVVHPARGRLAVSRRADRHCRLQRRPHELVQGRAADHGLRDHRDDVLLHAGGASLSLRPRLPPAAQ